jgi:hypothetical protein
MFYDAEHDKTKEDTDQPIADGGGAEGGPKPGRIAL